MDLKKLRHELWQGLTNDDETTWVTHFMLSVLIMGVPSGFIAIGFGSLVGSWFALGISEAWLLFMSGREVRDYLSAVYGKGDTSRKLRDGIGDIVGPLFVHLICWANILSVVSGLYG